MKKKRKYQHSVFSSLLSQKCSHLFFLVSRTNPVHWIWHIKLNLKGKIRVCIPWRPKQSRLLCTYRFLQTIRPLTPSDFGAEADSVTFGPVYKLQHKKKSLTKQCKISCIETARSHLKVTFAVSKDRWLNAVGRLGRSERSLTRQVNP